MRRMPASGIVAGLASAGVVLLGRLDRPLVERVYGRGAYPWIARVVSTITGAVPFAIAEIVAAALVAAAAVLAVRSVRRTRRAGRTRRLAALAALAAVLSVAGWTLTAAVWLYGLNLDRRATDDVWRIRGELSPVEVERAIDRIGRRVDALRVFLPEDGDGVVRMPSDLAELDAHLVPLQAEVLREVGLPRIGTGRAKRQLFGGFVRNYVSGYFSPLTLEPTVAWPPFPTQLPAVAAHERAHLSGFPHEDDASFVGFLTTIRSPRADVRYSGWLELWLRLGRDHSARSAAVQRDIAAYAAAVADAEGPAERAVEQVGDTLLKASGQPRGIETYGLVVARALGYLQAYGFPPDRYDAGQS